MTVGRIPSVEGGIQPTLLTTKGDIIVATGNATLVRQGVGSDNQVLMADSAQADGVKWGGDWQAWTPTYTNLTVGNGTVSARYQQIGKTVNFEYYLFVGTTTAIGSIPQITMPVAPKYYYKGFPMKMEDTGTTEYWGNAVAFADKFYLTVTVTSNPYAQLSYLSATVPMTWATTDALSIYGSYEVA
jgi:hypothetical protein